jgi:SAM-dependent methyltransferase
MSWLFGMLHRVNSAHPWSHNDAYSGWVLREARKARHEGGRFALDVGCGTGNLIRRLSKVVPEVTGVESDLETAERARVSAADLIDVTVINESFPLAEQKYDFVSFVASLHHLPLTEGIRAAHMAVAPGGRLSIVGVYREEASDKLFSVVSLLLNPVIGLVRHPRRVSEPLLEMTAPSTDAINSYAEIRAALWDQLPGVQIRRGLFWRYTAIWIAPRA